VVGKVPQKGVSYRIVIFEREISLDERRGIEPLVPILEVDAYDRFERARLRRRLRAVAFGIDPNRDLVSIHDLLVGVRHVVLPKLKLAKKHESWGGCFPGGAERTLHHLDLAHSGLPSAEPLQRVPDGVGSPAFELDNERQVY